MADQPRPILLNVADYKLDHCNICGNPRSEFYPFFSETPNRCKKCESLERHRIFKWAYDWYIRREFAFEGKDILSCTPGSAEMKYLLQGARVLKTFDIRPVAWFDLQMDICDMRQIPDESFDCFFGISILPHTKDDVTAIDEIHRVLRPGGRFFTQATNILNGRTKPYENVTKHYTEEEYKKYGVGTFRIYGDADLIKLIGRRFVVKTFHGFDPITGGTDFIACGIKDR
jgi:hypothetical protein